MGKLSKMSFLEIIRQVNFCIGENDIPYYCESKEANEEFDKLKKEGKFDEINVKRFFEKNEKSINKERFLLLTIIHYKEKIEQIEEQLNKINNTVVNGVKDISVLEFEKDLELQRKNLKRAIELAKEIKQCYIIPYKSLEKNRYEVCILNSEEIINGPSKKEKLKLETLHNVGYNLKENDRSIEYMISKLKLQDIYDIFVNEEVGAAIINSLLLNILQDQNIKLPVNINQFKLSKKILIDIFEEGDVSYSYTDIRKTIETYIRYVDIDKFIMIAAYRIEESLEQKDIDVDEQILMKQTLEELLKYAKKHSLALPLEYIKENGKKERSKYSYKNIQKCLNKFINGSYLRKEHIQEYKEQIRKGELNLQELDEEQLNIIYKQEELDELAMTSENNFDFVINKYGYQKEQIMKIIRTNRNCTCEILRKLVKDKIINEKDIIDLYMEDAISLEVIEKAPEIDLSEQITPKKLNSYNEAKEQYDKYLELSKKVVGRYNQDKKETYSEELIEEILENSQQAKHIELLGKYYKHGLLVLDTIASWAGEPAITEFYTNKIITLEDIIGLAQRDKISKQYAIDKYNEVIFNEECDYDKRLKYIKMGFITSDELRNLYRNGLIFKTDLKGLVNDKIINQDECDDIINGTKLEELERNSEIRLGDLENLTKKRNNNLYLNDSEKSRYKVKKNNLIIDPNEREEYLRMFGAYIAHPDELDENHPFYNYQFYVIPDKKGNIAHDSVVIAERYYENKDTEDRFAYNNATYFFRYEDLLVLSNLSKKEMTKERENVVFKVNHVLATENKPGSWAVNTFCTIAKTMLGSDLQGYSKENQRKIILEKLDQVYGTKRVMELLDKSRLIDEGNYICEIQDYVGVENKTFSEDER